MINFRKAAVKIGKTWHLVTGQDQGNGNLVFILNGRIEQAIEGYWRLIDRSFTQRDAECEVIRMNISELAYANPRRNPLRRMRR